MPAKKLVSKSNKILCRSNWIDPTDGNIISKVCTRQKKTVKSITWDEVIILTSSNIQQCLKKKKKKMVGGGFNTSRMNQRRGELPYLTLQRHFNNSICWTPFLIYHVLVLIFSDYFYCSVFGWIKAAWNHIKCLIFFCCYWQAGIPKSINIALIIYSKFSRNSSLKFATCL